MGVVFDPTYTYNYIHYNATLFPNDGWGLTGGVTLGSAHLHMDFSTPQYWIAIEHTGIVFFELYSSDQLIYTSPDHQGSAYTTPQPFFGLFSTAPFDTVVVVRPDANNVNIDNLYWGPGIPAPGALGLVGVAALTLRKRRRS